MRHSSTKQPELRQDMAALETRVSQSLVRLGYEEIEAIHLGSGHVKLTGSVPSQGDRAIVMAVARAVAGVTSVSCEVG